MSLGDAGGAAALRVAREPAGGRTMMFQSWRRLLFLHWKCDPAAVKASLPDGLEVDTFGGEAYVEIVPFSCAGSARGGFLRGVSDFLELNVRTYVRPRGGGPPGVWKSPIKKWTQKLRALEGQEEFSNFGRSISTLKNIRDPYDEF